MIDIDKLFDPKETHRPLICVEMSGNHQGGLEEALSFVRQAKECGADILKVQVYRPDTITLNSNNDDFKLSEDNDWSEYKTLYQLYEKAHTPWDWVEKIFELSKSIGLPVFASPFDSTAVEFLEFLECPIYKIASPEITDIGLIETCCKTKRPLILSTGLSSKPDLDLAVETLAQHDSAFMLLKCVSAYPTPVEEMNVATIPWLQNTYNCPTGLSDHSLGVEAAYAATALGARLIEKHFKLPGDTTSVDADFSMSLEHLPAFKKSIEQVFLAVGQATLDIPDIAKPSLSGRRSLYAIENIKVGEKITNHNVKSIRPSYGMHPKHLKHILGRTATKDIHKGEPIIRKYVD